VRGDRVLAKAAATAVLGGLLAAGYLLVARPYQIHWGATAAEVDRPMPGDTLSRRPTFLATRAITIVGTPADIWPWLVQMGYGRAGFYGYDILENLGSARTRLHLHEPGRALYRARVRRQPPRTMDPAAARRARGWCPD
jgi:hypothetical protein